MGKCLNQRIEIPRLVEPADRRECDGIGRKVTKVEGRTFEVAPPMKESMKGKMVLIYNWGAGAKDLKPNYRLRPDSPAIDSADASVKRPADMDGHPPTDAPKTPNTGAGEPAYLDRGAFEYVPPAK